METYAVWQPRPVFVTSTFRDMQAERDHLHRLVFPELEERLKARFHHLEPIDLRWGVDTASEADEEARQRLVLKVCLAEIERSRPFLIALIGDRYGWVPPIERMQAAAEEVGHPGELAGKSVTALEIEYGVLDNPEQSRRSRFYFREPLPYDTMDPASAALYSECRTGETGGGAAAAQLQALKERIQREQPERWKSYRADWDPEQRCVTGLEDWGRQVLEDLWSDLEAETKEYAAQAAGTWKQREALLLEQYIATKSRDFVGREVILDELMQLALSPAAESLAESNWGTCVTGPPGAGKSALFAQLHRGLAKENILLLAHAAGIGTEASRLDALLQRWIGELAAVLDIPDPCEELTKREDLEQTFASLLGRASTKKRVVCLLDALDQFERSPAGQYLTWLPKLWPLNARLIATAVPGTESEALAQRSGVSVLDLPLLDRNDAERIADTLCRRYRKTLPAQVRECLSQKIGPDGNPAAGIPLWLELTIETLLLLDTDDFARARSLPGTSTGERLRALLLEVAEAFPPEVDALYGNLLDRAEKIHGKEWTQAFVNLTALSRGGWREEDLKALLPKASGQPWSDFSFAATRRTLRAHLVQSGAQGQWDFAHAQLRRAVEGRNLADEDSRKALHTILADHLEGLPVEDPLRQSELMFHLIGSDDKPRVAAYFAGLMSRSSDLVSASRTLAEHLLVWDTETPNLALTWGLALLELPDQAPLVVGKLCAHYLYYVGTYLELSGPLGLQYSLLKGVQGKLARLAETDPANVVWQCDLAASHDKVGDALKARGDLAGAERAYRASLTVAECLAATDLGNAVWQGDLATSHGKVGDALEARGDLEGAERAYRTALQIYEHLTATDPGEAGWQHGLAVSQSGLGDVLVARGELSGAEGAYRTALEICTHLIATDPCNAGWQRDLATSHNKVGDALKARSDLEGAERAYRIALQIREQLTDVGPSIASWQDDLSLTYNRIGEVLKARGDLAGSCYVFPSIGRSQRPYPEVR